MFGLIVSRLWRLKLEQTMNNQHFSTSNSSCNNGRKKEKTTHFIISDLLMLLVRLNERSWDKNKVCSVYRKTRNTYRFKVKFSLHRSSKPLGNRKVKASGFSQLLAQEGGNVVTLTHQPSLPPGVFLELIFRGSVDPRAHGSIGSFSKNPQRHHWGLIPRLWLVVQCLDHYATPGPYI
jgi:hypothetical protein